MVEGFRIRKRVLVVDLDGTLITGNSLHEYIRAALRHSPLSVRVKIMAALVIRKLRLCSHLAMKRKVLRLIRPDSAMMSDFSAKIKGMLRLSVVEAIRRHRAEGGEVLLATAAPEVYIQYIWDGAYISTDSLADCECRGEEKLRRAVEYVSARGDVVSSVITDHPDDLPLLNYPGVKKILAGNAHARKFAALGVTFDAQLM